MSGAFPRPSRGAMLAIDLALVGWIVAWIVLGLAVAREVEGLNELGDTVVLAGGAIQQTGELLETLDAIPFVGARLGDLAGRITETGIAAQHDARASQESVRTLRTLLGIAVALVPSVPLVAIYLPLRVGWARDRRSVRRALGAAPEDPLLQEYLARRAAQALPYERLRLVSRDPWGDLAAGRFEPLARAELERLGLRFGPGRGSAGPG